MPDVEIEEFYTDFNAKIGQEEEEKFVGKYSLGARYNRGATD